MGCRQSLPTTPFFPFTPDETEPQNDNGWGAHVLDRMGLPIYFEGGFSGKGACFFDIKAGERTSVGEYYIEAYKGNHTIDVCHFIIKKEGKCLFYALDGAWLLYEEICAIWKNKPDIAVFDATVGFIEKDWRVFEHNNLNMVIEMKKSIGKDIKKYVISHMAYTLHTDHDTLSKEMEKHDIITAYDGMEIEF